MYDGPLTAVHHHHNALQNALNNVESTCVSFNPNSIAQLKPSKRDPRKRVTFAHCLVKNKWPYPTYKNEYLLFHSQDDKYDAQDAQPTCRECSQYKKEELQSFIDLRQAMIRWAEQTSAQKVSSRSTGQLRVWIKENATQRVRDRLTEQLVAPQVSNRPNVEPTKIVHFLTAQPAVNRMSNHPIVEHETAKRESATLINLTRNAMNISKYDDNDNENYSTSDDNYSVSEDGMPKLRRNYDDSSSNNTSNDNSVSTDGYDNKSNSNNSYVDELSYSDDE